MKYFPAVPNPLPVSSGGTGATSFTPGSVIFMGATALSEDNSNFFLDNATKRLGLLKNNPAYTLDAAGTGKFAILPSIGLPVLYSPSILFGYGGSYLNGDHIDYRAYSYVTVLGTRYYSEEYISWSFDITADAEAISWYMDIGSNAEGVRVFRDYNFTGLFEEYIDANSFTDDGTVWSFGDVRTPILEVCTIFNSYDDGTSKWSSYGDGKAFYGKLLVGDDTVGSYRTKITETGAQSALVVQGTNDGGFATYSQIEIRNSTGLPMFFIGDSNSGSTSAGVLNFMGQGNSGGDYRGELTFINNNLGGDKRVSTWRVVQGAGGTTTSDFYILTRNSGFGYNIYGNYLLNNGFGGITSPTAAVHMRAGSATANTAPMCFTSGALLATPVVGTVEFLIDKWYGTITSGPSRKEFALNDIALTTGRVATTTTNGRITDSANLTWNGASLGISGGTGGNDIQFGNGANRRIQIDSTGASVAGRTLTIGAGGGGTGTNIGGGPMILTTGSSTGNASLQTISFQTAYSDTSGTGANTTATRLLINADGTLTHTPIIRTAGNPVGILHTGAAHTGLTASAEIVDVNFNLARTVQRAAGAVTTQRAFRIQNPTYSFVSASTISDSATVSISGAPVAGTNATLTRAYALWVEAGPSRFDGVVQVKIGTSAAPNVARVGGVIFDNYADVGNVGTGEDDLHTNTLVASTLGVDGGKVSAHYSGVFVASATATRRLRAYFGGTLIYDSTALSLSVNTDWHLKVIVIRESSTVVRCVVVANTTSASAAPYCTYTRITGLTLTNTQILKITGEAAGVGAADNDIVAKFSSGNWEPSAAA